MASNSFGSLFRITTFGESHGPCMGVVIDGCPAGIALSLEKIQEALDKRAPGQSPFTSPRVEKDRASIVSGFFQGQTTGAPLTILIQNQGQDSSAYDGLQQIHRPGHASYAYMKKYGVFDHRGAGRASARETALRVAAGAVAQHILEPLGIEIFAYLQTLGDHPLRVAMPLDLLSASHRDLDELRRARDQHPFYTPAPELLAPWQNFLNQTKASGDSLGGIVAFIMLGVPAGLGDPIYEKLSAGLSSACMSIPAAKGFEIGEGFGSAALLGSNNNDALQRDTSQGHPFLSNHSGGILGGISTGQEIWGRVAFKAPSSIAKSQATIDYAGNPQAYQFDPHKSKHDPCVALRAVPVVEAMCALTLVDRLLYGAACSKRS